MSKPRLGSPARPLACSGDAFGYPAVTSRVSAAFRGQTPPAAAGPLFNHHPDAFQCVKLVSAIAVASTTLREALSAGAIARSCSAACKLPNNGAITTSTLPAPPVLAPLSDSPRQAKTPTPKPGLLSKGPQAPPPLPGSTTRGFDVAQTQQPIYQKTPPGNARPSL